MSPDAGERSAFAQAERGLQEIGYSEQLLRRDYAFADLLADSGAVRHIPLAAFAQDPPSYRNACFGVLRAGPQIHVSQYRALGAPQILEVDGHEVRRWKVTSTGAPELLQRIHPDDLLQTIREHHAEWGPAQILRARSIAFDAAPVQLDFFDAGLLPVIEAIVHTKLDRLLRDALAASKAAYSEGHLEELDFPKLFRLIFRLLAAKLLADRNAPGDWLHDDASEVVAAVERFYFGNRSSQPVLSDPETQRVAWTKIRSGFHLQNISVEALAYVYENTLVDRELRQQYGTHSTPREVAEYLVRRLPFDQLPLNERQVFEPFAGHAALLIAAMGALRSHLSPDTPVMERHEYFVRMLSGMEIDSFASEVARLSLMLADYPSPNGWRLINEDVFASPRLQEELGSAQTVLCNPPFEDFTEDQRSRYQDLRSVNKAADILLRTLDQAPNLLGFVLPLSFIDGLHYREARQLLAKTYGSIELVALPDSAFEHSGVETVLLVAFDKGRPLSHLRSAQVAKTDYEQFIRTGQPTREDAAIVASGEAESSKTGPVLWLHPLQRVWRALDGLPQLEKVADIRNGIYYGLSVRDESDRLISGTAREGFRPGLVRIRDGFEPLTIRDHVYLNMDPEVMYQRSKADRFPWHLPKVIVNRARLSRGPWTITGATDWEGLVAYHLFHAIWPLDRLPLQVLAAIVNGPVANAFVSMNRTSRDNRVETINRIPIPQFSSEQVAAITKAVNDYRSARTEWLTRPLEAPSFEARCRQALFLIDAELLVAYDLPPRVERELLDHFAGFRRPGPVRFDRYYPDGFRPAVPLKMYVSGQLERASARQTLDRLTVVHDPALSEMVAEFD
jgi:hypothetical protein